MKSRLNRYDNTTESFKKEQIVYETYDLLHDDERVRWNGNDIQVQFPSDINNLSHILLRVFKPKKHGLIEGYQNASNDCVLKPYVFNVSTGRLANIYEPYMQLYAYNDSRVLNPITEPYKFTVPFTIAVKFTDIINDNMLNYLSQFTKYAFGKYDSETSTWNISSSEVVGNDLILMDDEDHITIKPVYMGDYMLVWALDLHVSPLDIYNISEFNVINELSKLYESSPKKDSYVVACTYRADNYTSYYNKYVGASNNYYLILSSPYMKNLSHIVYIEGYEPTITYKEIVVNPAQQVIILRLLDASQNVLSKDKVNDIYSNVWVSIDYVFSNYIN